jgi:hypothetical protein
VGFVHNHQIPIHGDQLVLHVFVAAQFIEAAKTQAVFLKPVAGPGGLQSFIGENVEIEVSLLLSAIENTDLAAVIPKPAIAELSKERFASIETEELQSLTLELSLVYSPLAAQLRENVRRLAPRISTLFGA